MYPLPRGHTLSCAFKGRPSAQQGPYGWAVLQKQGPRPTPVAEARAVLGTFELSLRKRKSCHQAATAHSKASCFLSELR